MLHVSLHTTKNLRRYCWCRQEWTVRNENALYELDDASTCERTNKFIAFLVNQVLVQESLAKKEVERV